jgi:alkaline phosphatase D
MGDLKESPVHTPRTVLALTLMASLAVGLSAPAHAQETKIASSTVVGPILGHVDTNYALLWVRAPGVREITLTVGDGSPVATPLKQLGRGFATARLDGLTADTAYQVSAKIPGLKDPVALSFRTAPPAVAFGKVRFGVGSCARRTDQPVWAQVEKAAPDLFLWLGDNCYYSSRKTGGNDWDRLDWMIDRQMWERRKPGLLRTMQRMACYATWDDHDFGPNNSNSSFPLRAESRLVHRYMWANPSYGESEKGVYFSFRRGPIEFFMLDARFFKDVRNSLPKAQRQLYGERQIAWLRAKLEASTAPMKVVGGGVQQLLGYPYAEGWDQAPSERKKFLDWIAKKGSRVLFLSGDVHVSELYHVPLGNGVFAWELTSSALANGSRYSPAFLALQRKERKWCVVRPNFCVVEVDIPEGDIGAGTVRFQCIGADGDLEQETRTTLSSFGKKRTRRSF